MPAIIFAGLKWIGIVLGCIIALAIVLLACVLFVPIRYRIDGSAGEEHLLKVRLSWLFHIVHLSVVVSGEGEHHKIYVFGIPLGERKKKVGKASKKPAGREPEKPETFEAEAKEPEKPETFEAEAKEPEKSETFETEAKEPEQSSTPRRKEPSGEDKTSKQKKKFFKKRAARQKKGFSLSIKDRLGKIRDKGKAVSEMFRDDNTPELITLLKENAGLLLRHIKPTKIKGWLHFGTSDPCLTGQILGALGILFAMWGKGISITPDFEEKVLEGEVTLRGGLKLIFLGIVLIRVLPSRQWQHWKKQWDAM
jgi:hypothetical protein